MSEPVAVFWFRRDLRFEDNVGLYQALQGDIPVLPIFIFDTTILNELEDTDDARVTFIHQTLCHLNERLHQEGSGILSFYGAPVEVFKKLLVDYKVTTAYANRDYEPYARERDEQVRQFLMKHNVTFHTIKDHVIHEPHEVVKDDGAPYKVFTPYSKAWKHALTRQELEPAPGPSYDRFIRLERPAILPLEKIGFTLSQQLVTPFNLSMDLLNRYADERDFPGLPGTSRLSAHLRFGTVSIRQVVKTALEARSDQFVNELIWREFYQMILWHFPRVVHENFKTQYNGLTWRNNEREFEAWCKGETGYPIVDAGMRELNATGYMHNRVRMITASFLTKHLLIDWRWGESYFARKLLDFELASNNGGWQWSAGTGTDAQPYFRIFNPESQTKKFDPELKYIKQWVPEFQELHYPRPLVDHKMARERALNAYKKAINTP